jgi:hypothetical protein
MRRAKLTLDELNAQFPGLSRVREQARVVKAAEYTGLKARAMVVRSVSRDANAERAEGK